MKSKSFLSGKNILSIVLMSLSVIIFIAIMATKGKKLENFVSIGTYTYIIFLVIAILASLFMSYVNLSLNPKSLKRIFIVLGILLVFFIIGYAMDSKTVENNWKSMISTSTQSGVIGGSLTTTWILLFISIAVAIGTAVYSSIKKS